MLIPSEVLAVLEELGQGWVELRAQGLEEVELVQGPKMFVGCSPPQPSYLLAWALAAASFEKKRQKGVVQEGAKI